MLASDHSLPKEVKGVLQQRRVRPPPFGVSHTIVCRSCFKVCLDLRSLHLLPRIGTDHLESKAIIYLKHGCIAAGVAGPYEARVLLLIYDFV
jgi:hypothetical protein